MKNLNLSRWALEHKSLVVYLMLVVALAGLMQYGKLGREEDPPFTIKTMVVKTVVARRHDARNSCSRSPTASKRSSRSCRTSII